MSITAPQRDLFEQVAIIDPESGELIDDEIYSPYLADIGDTDLREIYRDLVVVRRLDAEATALQRQGQLGLWAPLAGQEAAQIGSARALRPSDFVFPSYREHGVAYVRGVDPAVVLRMWRGTTLAGWNPRDVNMMTPAIVIGPHMLFAVGYGMGILRDKTLNSAVDDIVIAYCGDGGTSQGDFSEALGFAASFRTPTVFIVQNNQYAISSPVGIQATVPIVQRAAGFGVHGIRVDGNDVLAVLAVTRHAAERARAGDGPTLIEAVTYRMGPHTTSDDPTRYRDAAELEFWRQRDPIDRLRLVLDRRGLADQEFLASVDETADRYAAEVREACIATPDPDPISLFDNVYATETALLAEERTDFADLHGLDLQGSGE
jgi:2-oxoisovalerate dehydrogenase E1 component alpha subunit